MACDILDMVHCYSFWKKKDPDILMKVINLIGWFISVTDKPVIYNPILLCRIICVTIEQIYSIYIYMDL